MAPVSVRRALPWLAVAAWAAAIFGVSGVAAADLPPQPGPTSYIAHFTEYAILGGLLFWALRTTRLARGWAVGLAIGVASLYGASDEFHQWFTPGRVSDPRDWLTDTLGAGLAVAVLAWWARRRQY
jgi:VanZ family protein